MIDSRRCFNNDDNFHSLKDMLVQASCEKALTALCTNGIMCKNQFIRAEWTPLYYILRESGVEELTIMTLAHLHGEDIEAWRPEPEVPAEQSTPHEHSVTRNLEQFWGTPDAHFATYGNHAEYLAVADHQIRAVPRPAPPTRGGRKDFPLLRDRIDSKRTKLATALYVTRFEQNRDEAIQILEQDRFANSSRAPRNAWWDTWCEIARAWGLPPLPVTPELVQKIAASFKAAGYRSAALYFHVAKQTHLQQYGAPINIYTKQCIKDYIRSITRGLGTDQMKTGFFLENLYTTWSTYAGVPSDEMEEQVESWRFSPGAPSWWRQPKDIEAHKPVTAERMVILGCWFMTREIEIASSTLQQVTLDHEAMTVTGDSQHPSPT